MPTTEHLYLLLKPKRQWKYGSPRIARIAKSRSSLRVQPGEAIVHLQIELPDNILNPPEVRVQIRPEHVAAPAVTVTPQTP